MPVWIGGPPGAGKSTVARLLARRHGLRWYNADAHTWEHRDRALAAGTRPHTGGRRCRPPTGGRRRRPSCSPCPCTASAAR